jgi:hypothetical protein
MFGDHVGDESLLHALEGLSLLAEAPRLWMDRLTLYYDTATV